MPAVATTYPRPGGVVVPAVLAPVLGPGAQGRHLSDWVQRNLRALPEEVLELSLPNPGEILDAWRLSPRTQGAIARIDGRERHSWKVRDYMGRRGMGVVAVIDLLAAREENSCPNRAPVAPARSSSKLRFDLSDRVREIAVVLREHLPAKADEVGHLLVTAGIATQPPSVDDLARAFRMRGDAAPFRVVRRLGANLLVEPHEVAATEALLAAAARAVFDWGLCTIDDVLDRLGSLSASTLSVQAAARIVGALPQLRWLDGARRWFSFVGRPGRVGESVRKIFGIVEAIPVRELAEGLGKRLVALPRFALERFLVDVMGCEIREGWVSAASGFAAAALDGVERALIAVMCRSGGVLDLSTLRAEARTLGVGSAAVRRFLRTSPLVRSERGQLRIAGVLRCPSPAGAGAAVPGLTIAA